MKETGWRRQHKEAQSGQTQRAAIYQSVKSATAFTPEKKGISCCPNYDYGNQARMQGERFTLTKELFSILE